MTTVCPGARNVRPANNLEFEKGARRKPGQAWSREQDRRWRGKGVN
jgi:hypothetical protein